MNHQFNKLDHNLQSHVFDAKENDFVHRRYAGMDAKTTILKDGKYSATGNTKQQVLKDGKYQATGNTKQVILRDGTYSATGSDAPADLTTAASHLKASLSSDRGVTKVAPLKLNSGWHIGVKIDSHVSKDFVNQHLLNGKYEGFPVVIKHTDDKSNVTGDGTSSAVVTQVKILGMPPLTFAIVGTLVVIGISVGAYFIFKKKAV